MYAIIKTGGKQYRVAPGQRLKVEKLLAEEGQAIEFDDVLMTADGEKLNFGKGKVQAEVLAHGRAKKVEILKFRRRKHSMKRQGHRQDFTEVKITDIKG